ncbi:MAG: hypothetical protein A2381_10955 [Bdellovibrionales bacterium RIFOXYB1_FULL_37_110]|nr:MAG: hypothetical protein A2181_07095 [Bdellovibrionales bacterium RIFOXYA1_FULL_38_20]OFZ51183.1 MAG: hypothetical protein A2417_17940 [Bdellovibrionales bacterium RIFOXYC1_FULL_37_79]OFZ61289.1 MAG: hypothetical protein A2381_10955 [Bdellovibrionales bacterium RIFOXYB1_FULL_37_110]OFZ62152.1 MAG: hypothetical protein A2577_14530 [Bdellovibrionales bacterium RIFOXYD1_FULL_36_51]
MKANNIFTDPGDNIPENAPKTICLLQLTRIGDILQTYQAAEIFKQQYPHYKLILIARTRFAHPLSFLLRNVFDKTYYVDQHVLKLDSSENLPDLVEAFKTIIDNLKNESISVLLNLSFSKSSGYLASIIPAEHKMGLVYDASNNVAIKDKWSQYIYSNVMGGPLNPFNLVDIFKSMLGHNLPALSHPQKPFKKVSHILLHPFASHDKKMWKINKWEEILYQLLKNFPDIDISIVGSPEEIIYGKGIDDSPLLQKYKERLHNKIGKTSLEDIYNLFDNIDLFIGHDSMVGHLASIKNVPTITISLGTVRAKETSPYGEKNYTITPQTNCFPCFPQDKCEFYQCHFDISYQVLYSSLKEYMETGNITKEYQLKNSSCFHLNAVAIYKSKLSPIGFLQLDNILEEKSSVNDVFSTLYRISWQFILNNSEEPQKFLLLSTKSHQILLNTLNGLQHLYELSDFGKKYSRYILEEISSSIPRIEKIKEYSAKIDEIDSLTKLVKQTHPHLSPVIDFYTVQKGNLAGDNIVELTESSFLLYNDSLNAISVLYELIEKTITEHKTKNRITDTSTEYNY